MYRSSKDSVMGEWNTLFKYCWRTSLTMEHVEERQLDADDVLTASGISDTCGDLNGRILEAICVLLSLSALQCSFSLSSSSSLLSYCYCVHAILK